LHLNRDDGRSGWFEESYLPDNGLHIPEKCKRFSIFGVWRMKRAVFLLFILFPISRLSAQDFFSWQYNDRYFTLSAGTGHTRYFGELNNGKGFQKGLSNASIGIEGRLLSKWSARAEFAYYNVSGSDSYADDSTYNRQRNLSFKTNNFEGYLGAVYYFKPYNKIYHKRRKFEPYAHLGAGITSVNPQAEINGGWEKLRPLATEGETYKGRALIVPFGVGVKARISSFINLVGELGYRYTFTDRLDDVSAKYGSSFGNPLGQLLSNRKDEVGVINEAAYESMIPGGQRGIKGKDSYLMLQWKLEFYLPGNLLSGGTKSWFSKPSAF